jgi:hypothetical protein
VLARLHYLDTVTTALVIGLAQLLIIAALPGTPSCPACKTKHAVTFACTTKVGVACGLQLPI